MVVETGVEPARHKPPVPETGVSTISPLDRYLNFFLNFLKFSYFICLIFGNNGIFIEWCRRWDLNPQPTGYESVALPIGATPAIMARTEGFEPPSMVLETTVLPLNYARIIFSRNNGGEGRIRTCEP